MPAAPVIDLSTLTAAQGFIIQGDAAFDVAGHSVSSAGDVNGDGIEDLIVGAPLGDDGGSNVGEAYVIYGVAGATRGTIDLTELTAAQGFIIQGDAGGAHAGYGVLSFSVSSAGDVNGDGIDDLIVGTPNGNDGGTYAGEAYVIYGVTGATRGTVDLSAVTVAQGFIIQGDAASDFARCSISSAGDVNGDGIDDMIVGVPSGDDGGAYAGEAYVIYGVAGATRGTVDLTGLTTAQGFVIQGDVTGDLAGWSVSSAGDVNGDGIDDLIVGAPHGDDVGIYDPYSLTFGGEAYVIYGVAGSTRGTLDLSALIAAQGFLIQGDGAYDQAGFSVSSAGDVNGDGIDDLIVGAPNGVDDDRFIESGEAYVIYGVSGATRGTVDLSALTVAQGFIIQGDASMDFAGFSISSAGDVNGDGLDDMIVGAPRGDNGGTDAGEAYVVFGVAGNTKGTVDLSALTAAQGFIIQGDAAGDQAGWSVSSAGDVNGDGIDDLIVGARYGDNGGTNAGEAYVIYGSLDFGGTYRPTDLDLEYMAKQTAYERGPGDLPPDYAVSQIFSDGAVDGFYAVAVTSPTGEPVLAIRGSDSLLDVVADLDPEGVGYSQLLAVWPEIRAWLLCNPGAHITGHSLGGAQAQLVAAWATDEGIRIGNVATFNAPGIDTDQAVRFDASLSLGVSHHIAMGDVVSMVGEAFLSGELLYYDFQTIDLFSLFGPLTQPVNAHTGHWAQPEMWDFSDRYEQYEPSVSYGPGSDTLTTGDLGSGLFSHLYSGDYPDVEYAAFLLTLAGLGLPTIAAALTTRATAETLRETAGLGVLSTVSLVQLSQAIRETIAEAAQTMVSWTVETMLSIPNWTAATWQIIASFSGEIWAEMRNWASDTVQDIANWSVAQLNAVADLGAAGVERLIELRGEIQSGLIETGSAIGDWIIETRDALNWSQINPFGQVQTVDGNNSILVSTASVLLSGSTGSTLQSTVSGSMFMGGAGSDIIDMTTGANVIWGLPQTLNNDFVRNFGVTDALIYAIPSVSAVTFLPPQPGSAILALDIDGDGAADTTITLEGDYDLDLFVMAIEDGNVVITYGTPTFDGALGDDLLGGTIRADRLNGNEGNDTLQGLAGNDTLYGGLGADLLDGGAGIDMVVYRDSGFGMVVDLGSAINNTGIAAGDTFVGIENLAGSEQSDTLRGDTLANAILGYAGNDLIAARAGNDSLYGDAGNDTLIGGAGADLLDGGAGARDRAQYTDATAGLRADLQAPGANTGFAAGDIYIGVEDLHGSSHSDTLLGDAGANIAWGDSGNDMLNGRAGSDTLHGGDGNDDLQGGAGADMLFGGAGARDQAAYSDALAGVTLDMLFGGTNTGDAVGDVLTEIEDLQGSAFGDRLLGDSGVNHIWGDDGDDVIFGRVGPDRLYGGTGNDILLGGAGADLIDGGTGIRDRVQYSDATAGLRADLMTPATNSGFAAGDSFVGIEDLHGSTHADTLFGDSAANIIWGVAGADMLYGRVGADTLQGGLGNDTLTGGAGLDHFVFNSALGVTNVDQIADFLSADDTIRLENAIFTALLSTGALAASAFTNAAAATTTAHRVVYHQASGQLFYDADGSGSGGQIMFATVTAGTAINASDFLVI